MSESDYLNDPKKALIIICLFLAQKGETYSQLGFSSQADAFRRIGELFEVPARTVQNERDAFDAFTDSERVGWVKDELPPRLSYIFDKYGHLPMDELHRLASKILDKDWTQAMKNALPDLEAVIAECRARLKLQDPSVTIEISDNLWAKIISKYKIVKPSDTVEVIGAHTLRIVTPDEKNVSISGQEIPQCWAVIPYVRALKEYELVVNRLVQDLTDNDKKSSGIKGVFKALPSNDWRDKLDISILKKIDKWIDDEYENDDVSKNRLLRFFSEKQSQYNPAWSAVSKELSRNDWLTSATV